MKVLITYSSKTGNTQKLAEGIFNHMKGIKVDIKEISKVDEISEYSHILVGYWVDKGGPNIEAAQFMSTIKNKKVGIFATLGAYPDSQHGWNSLLKGEDIVKDNNIVIGKYICQGAVDPKIIDIFRSFDSTNPHAITPEKLKRYEIAKMHPNEADINSAAIMFRERL